ncbi:hypothetical protein M8C21_003572 [Ambrosia artemisiifolia]|uniref:Uncharacterized protein n=1 Tax=Ambrosia artemisiifolia TaxID=4212 RepID=A0AAD5CMM5_AMBAR|nr:hypothetical protein M8C21_003572 [Ambrosia artemisiifolia]
MDVNPTPFPGNKTQSVKSKYKKISEPPKHKSKEVPVPVNRRTFGTIRNHNVPETTLPQNPKPKPKPKPKSSDHIPQTQPKTTQNESNEKSKLRNNKKKTVGFTEKNEGSMKKKSPAKEKDAVKTPVRPPFSVKPVRVPGTPYLSAEKCSGCRFDRLETASYWVGQIKSAESVGKHFVAAAFFRLANECKAEPVKNLQVELKRYLTRHEELSATAEWEDVSRMYGKIKKEHVTENGEKMSCFCEKTVTNSGSELGDFEVVQEQRIENENGSGEINK